MERAMVLEGIGGGDEIDSISFPNVVAEVRLDVWILTICGDKWAYGKA